jgi:hypothetical protein
MTEADNRQTTQDYRFIEVSGDVGAPSPLATVDEEVVVIDGRAAAAQGSQSQETIVISGRAGAQGSQSPEALILGDATANGSASGSANGPASGGASGSASSPDSGFANGSASDDTGASEPAPLVRRIVIALSGFGFLLIVAYVLQWWGVIRLPF